MTPTPIQSAANPQIKALRKLAQDIQALEVVDHSVPVKSVKDKGSIKQWLAKSPAAKALFAHVFHAGHLIMAG